MNSTVIVIGAGISGISAAQNLRNNNIPVTILEARHRPGGRIHKFMMTPNLIPEAHVKALKFPEIAVQLGANWIHNMVENSNPLFSFAHFNHFPLHQTSSDDNPGLDVLLFDPNAEDNNPIDFSPETYKELLSRYEWIRDHQFDISFQECVNRSDCKENVSLQAVFDDAIAQSEIIYGPLSPALRRGLNWCADRIAIDMAGPLTNISASAWLHGGSDGDGGEALVIGGMSRVFDAILAGTPLDINYGAVVNNIEQNNTGVIVTCTDGRKFEAGYCMVSIPIGCLKANHVNFTPLLCTEKVAALQRVEAGLMNLVILWFPFAFWPEGYNFLGVARETGAETTFSTFLVPNIIDSNGKQAAVLMCQVFGSFAEKLESRTKSDVAAEATRVLRTIFPAVPEPIGCEFSKWRADPYSKGAWSLLKLGSNPEDHAVLAKNEGRIYFIGEHTIEEFEGTVHGAFLSGKRETDKLLIEIGTEISLPPSESGSIHIKELPA